ncbi:uncharacterized protein PAC_17570 [Phialocephala subalpina]|uniref:SnoaL-like domain-containing protein n=1 Tax=Phialocephala subalpina TaxID=576137 RepID=A0A1L7XRI3_9HELO|nr:uncharacterized protein PAC_17570 [Phialocephala subalpina]
MVSTRYSTAMKFFKAADDVDLLGLMAIRSPTCLHYFAPTASSGPRPPLDNTTYEAHMNQFGAVAQAFPMTIKEIMEDQTQNRVMIWATGGATWKDEAMDSGLSAEEWKFEGEWMFIFSMDESGEKIDRVVEFVDTKATDKLRTLMARALGNVSGKK